MLSLNLDMHLEPWDKAWNSTQRECKKTYKGKATGKPDLSYYSLGLEGMLPSRSKVQHI